MEPVSNGVLQLDVMFLSWLALIKSWLAFFFYVYISFIAWPLKLWLRLVFFWIGITEQLPIMGPKVKKAKAWVT